MTSIKTTNSEAKKYYESLQQGAKLRAKTPKPRARNITVQEKPTSRFGLRH